ncbi:MAG: hypothetical protein QGG71_24980 [Pirellulaceae bacterium]|nr:hypothetical protein [Pirellulaceae bacterium]
MDRSRTSSDAADSCYGIRREFTHVGLAGDGCEEEGGAAFLAPPDGTLGVELVIGVDWPQSRRLKKLRRPVNAGHLCTSEI